MTEQFDGFLMVSPTEIVPLVVNALKEFYEMFMEDSEGKDERIQALEDENNELRLRIEALEQKIAR